jgi:hypothetical protein
MNRADLRGALARSDAIEAAVLSGDTSTALALIAEGIEYLGNVAETTDDPEAIGYLVAAGACWTEAALVLVS